jgi:hypothetical protein
MKLFFALCLKGGQTSFSIRDFTKYQIKKKSELAHMCCPFRGFLINNNKNSFAKDERMYSLKYQNSD